MQRDPDYAICYAGKARILTAKHKSCEDLVTEIRIKKVTEEDRLAEYKENLANTTQAIANLELALENRRKELEERQKAVDDQE